MAQYIYLLQEREFIKTNENIYKVGMTKKENLERFNQYPKGSVLLFQMICNNCKYIETQLITLFKQQFILRKDIGNEYFEGDYKKMINIIYTTITNEIDNINKCDNTSEYCDNEYIQLDIIDTIQSDNNKINVKTRFFICTRGHDSTILLLYLKRLMISYYMCSYEQNIIID